MQCSETLIPVMYSSKLLCHPQKYTPARPVLVGEFADAGLAAQEIDLVEGVHQIEAHRQRPAGYVVEAVRGAEIELFVRGDRGFIDVFAGRLGTEARPGDDVGAELGA